MFLKHPSDYRFWILLGIIVKFIPFFFLLHSRPPSDITGIWAGTIDHDSHSYLDPIDTFLKTGNYSPDYRMPGYGFVYLLFRYCLPFNYACNVITILQFLLAGISVYYLALIAKFIFKNNTIFYLSYYLYLISTYSNFYDGWIMTESFCSSALIFSIYFFLKYLEQGKTKHLVFSGLFITWTIFLRPIFTPVLLLFLFILFSQKQTVAKVFLYILPFFILDGAWAIHNYNNEHKIILLVPSPYSHKEDTSYIRPLVEFIRAWGGSADYCDNNSFLNWFGMRYGKMTKPFKLPDYIYTSKFNKDSLLIIKNKVTALNDSSLSPEKTALYQNQLKTSLSKYTLSIKQEKPLLYYIEARVFYSLPIFLFGQESTLYFKRFQIGTLGNFFTLFFTLLYYILLLTGITGSFIVLFKEVVKSKTALIIALIPLYIIIVHGIILMFTNNRYLMPTWPLIIICAAYTYIYI